MNGPEPLSAVDAAWLRMDRPTNRMLICGMMLFEQRVELPLMKDVIRRRMLCFHRFRQRVVGNGAGACWETDEDFDLDWHVRRMALPAGASLEQVAGDLVSTPLDRSRPMWQFHLIDDSHGGSAVLLRIHHCYGDGFALMHVLACMIDAEPGHWRATPADLGGNTPSGSAWERLLGPAGQSAGLALRAALSATMIGSDLLLHPFHALDYARAGAEYASALAQIADMKPDAASSLKGALGGIKRVAWAAPVPLSEVKALAAALACSVNDVLVACIAGALRNYLDEQGDCAANAEVRALVPVNLRAPGPVSDLGNRFGMVFLSLPVAMEDPVERVREVHRRMAALRHSRQAVVSLGILDVMGRAPDFLNDRLVDVLAANASMVISNVRGAERPCYFAGRQIARQLFWVPQSGGIGLGISLLSYAGSVALGVMADARRLPDPGVLARHFVAEFETLLLAMLMMPWPEDRQSASGRPRRH